MLVKYVKVLFIKYIKFSTFTKLISIQIIIFISIIINYPKLN